MLKVGMRVFDRLNEQLDFLQTLKEKHPQDITILRCYLKGIIGIYQEWGYDLLSKIPNSRKVQKKLLQ